MAHEDDAPHHPRRRGAAGSHSAGVRSSTSKEAILGAATELMAERGFAATSIGSICKATELAPTAIYWHFGSKDGLLAAIVERSIERWYAELVQAMGERPAPTSAPMPACARRRLGALLRGDDQGLSQRAARPSADALARPRP
ncbi:MAG: TetR/AcrR family transcriptional regulator [Microthrixaceae bacterium]|nr:TetR/AcrR family transcriptional regulator [Microthrixaceae bacterium]